MLIMMIKCEKIHEMLYSALDIFNLEIETFVSPDSLQSVISFRFT